MTRTINAQTSIRIVKAQTDTEDYYRRLLPESVVRWCLLEAPIPFTFESLHAAYQSGSGGDKAFLHALKGAMAIDLANVLKRDGLDPSQHPYIRKYGR